MAWCNQCGREWPKDCESSVCISMFGACLYHLRGTMTDEQLKAVHNAYESHRMDMRWIDPKDFAKRGITR